ncbi:MAG TPA: hypothetical protein VLT92_16740 [Burkholderiales bacterium]|nr:hypothetical protein [Burkholderiales bacterium]
MTGPTIESRLRRRFILMSGDDKLAARLRDELPAGWEMTGTADLDELGGFQDVLQYRFVLLDLDGTEAFDPLDVIRQIRMELMLNIAIICFGGAPDMRNEARLARADRFFERSEIVEKMRLFCNQYGWGE